MIIFNYIKTKKINIIILFIFFVLNPLNISAGQFYEKKIEIPVLIWKYSVVYEELLAGLKYYANNPGGNFFFKYIMLEESKKKAFEYFLALNNSSSPAIILLGTGLAELILSSPNFKSKTKLIFAATANIRLNSKFSDIIKKNGENIFLLSYSIDFRKKIDIFEKLFFQINTVGILYNPKNEASLYEMIDIKNYCVANKINVIEYILPPKEDRTKFNSALKEYTTKIRNIDLLIALSNTEITNNIDLLIDTSFTIPVLCYQKEALHKKGFISICPNIFYHGNILFEYLNNVAQKKKSDFQVSSDKFSIFLNYSMLHQLSLSYPLKYAKWIKPIK